MLRTFIGKIPMFLESAKSRAESLEKLEHLIVIPSPESANLAKLQIREMIDFLLTAKGAPRLGSSIREVDFGLAGFQSNSHDFIIKIITDCARIFGNSLEKWSDILRHPIAAETLASSFALFPNLRMIHLTTGVMREGPDSSDLIAMEIVEAYVKRLAERCIQLEEVHVSTSHGEVQYIKRIIRSEEDLHVV